MMDYTLYQIDPEKDQECALFQGTKTLERAYGFARVDRDIYKEVYSGHQDREDLEDVYRVLSRPESYEKEGFTGRAMTVSDVLEVKNTGTLEPGFYFCDNVGFRKIPFLSGPELDENMIQVVLAEPGKEAKIVTIPGNLESMQETVGGYIEVYCPFEDGAVVVCNDEGKINGMKPCRAIYDNRGEMMDVVFGTFFICDGKNETMGSLSKEQLDKYLEQFREPEKLVCVNQEYCMVKCPPQKEKTNERGL